MQITEYILEIFEPNSANDCLITFKSSNPFMTISPGDLLNPYAWDLGIKNLLKVVNVEHIIWISGDEVKHKIEVFTKEVPDARETKIEK